MSLRSVEAHFKVRDVYIIGYKPDWLQDVIHLDIQDPFTNGKNKDGNITQKVLAACCLPGLSNRFVRMSDDQYFIKNLSIEDFETPISTNNYDKNSRGLWHRRMKATKKVLQKRGRRSINFESHSPVVLNKIWFPAAVCEYDFGNDIGYCGNTLYFNTIGVEPSNDKHRVHVSRRDEQYDSLIQGCSNAKFLNINGGVTQQHKAFLETIFPDATQYEA